MKKTLQNRHIQSAAAFMAADFIIFTMVNPRQASAPWLIIGYLLLGLTVFALARLFIHLLGPQTARARKLSRRASYYAAGSLVALIGLQSIGQLTPKDVITLLPLVILAYAYVAYGNKTVLE